MNAKFRFLTKVSLLALSLLLAACSANAPVGGSGSKPSGANSPVGSNTPAVSAGDIQITHGVTDTTSIVSGTVPGSSDNAATAPVAVNSEGYMGPTTAEAKLALGLDVQRLKTEPSAFVWRGRPASSLELCPTGWICTVDEKLQNGSRVVVDKGADKVGRIIYAGTFRFVTAYSSDDAVYEPCRLLAQEQEFGSSETPSFPVYPGNFDCDNQKGVGFVPATLITGSAGAGKGAAAVITPTVVANNETVPAVQDCKDPQRWGGDKAHWVWHANQQYWKYGADLKAPTVQFSAPNMGHIDGDGWTLQPGDSGKKSGQIATWQCN